MARPKRVNQKSIKKVDNKTKNLGSVVPAESMRTHDVAPDGFGVTPPSPTFANRDVAPSKLDEAAPTTQLSHNVPIEASQPPQAAPAAPPKLAMIFLIQGGAGDVLAATPMIRHWRQRYPQDELVVLSTYPVLWDGNANVDRVLPLADPEDVFEQYKNRLRFFKKHFVYDHIYDIPGSSSRSLPEFICRVYDAEYDGGPLDYFIKPKEIRIAKTFLSQFKKPVILLHLFGAIPSEGVKPMKVHNHKDLHFEDIGPVVEKYKAQFDFVQIGLIGEPVLQGAFDGLGMPMREAIAVVSLCKTFIFIESLFAHCANALRKVGVVVFNNTSPAFFGYPTNVNVSHSGGCDKWPCSRPLGALLDIQAGYFDPKSRQRPLWTCENQLCARTPPKMIEDGLLEALKRIDAATAAMQGPAKTLNEARAR